MPLPLIRTCETVADCSGHETRRICRPSRDHGDLPAIDPQGDGSVRHGRAVHYVRFCAAAVWDSRRLLWLSKRSLWWHWGCYDGAYG